MKKFKHHNRHHQRIPKREARKMTTHHLTPRCRGGNDSPSNISRLDEKKHQAWHILFGIKTLEEVILFLIRYLRLKKRRELNLFLEKSYCTHCVKDTYFFLSRKQISYNPFYTTHYATCTNCGYQKTIFKERR